MNSNEYGALSGETGDISTGTTQEIERKLVTYIENKYNLDMDTYYYKDISPESLTEYVKQALQSKETPNIMVSSQDFDLYTMDRELYQSDVGGHAMSVTGLTDDGKIIV